LLSFAARLIGVVLVIALIVLVLVTLFSLVAVA
jgi:Tfp pilus assembly protein PilX